MGFLPNDAKNILPTAALTVNNRLTVKKRFGSAPGTVAAL